MRQISGVLTPVLIPDEVGSFISPKITTYL